MYIVYHLELLVHLFIISSFIIYIYMIMYTILEIWRYVLDNAVWVVD